MKAICLMMIVSSVFSKSSSKTKDVNMYGNRIPHSPHEASKDEKEKKDNELKT